MPAQVLNLCRQKNADNHKEEKCQFLHNNEVQEVAQVAARAVARVAAVEAVAVEAAAPGAPVSAWPAGTRSRTSAACPALK